MVGEKPIIYFAFANQEGKQHLAALNEEVQRIKSIFSKSHLNGDITLLTDEYAGIKEIEERFTAIKGINKEKNQPIIIHFSGHADNQNWFLSAEHTITKKRLKVFLNTMNNVQLVFMNACCTKDLKDFLLDEIGVKAVIATSKKVNDRHATIFATKFYTKWIEFKNKPIIQAFEETCAGEGLAFETKYDADFRGVIREDDDDEIIPWGLYFKEEQAKNIVLNKGFEFEVSQSDYSLLSEYSKAQKLAGESAKELDKQDKELLPFSNLSESDIPENFRGLFNLTKENREKAFKIAIEHNKIANDLWLKIINSSNTPQFKQAFDTFNFSKEDDFLYDLTAGSDKGVPKGVYLLRGTADSGLSLLSHRIITYGRILPYNSMNHIIDFSNISDIRNPIEKIKEKVFTYEEKQKSTINSLDELAKAIIKFRLTESILDPYILILNHVNNLGQAEIENILLVFWNTLRLEMIKDKDIVVRQLVVVLIETIEAQKKTVNTNDDYDLSEAVEEVSVFCSIPIARLPQNSEIFPFEKIEKLKEKDIKVFFKNNNKLFSRWANECNKFLDNESPYAEKTLLTLADELKNEDLKVHIENRKKFIFT
jgi:CHAT domain